MGMFGMFKKKGADNITPPVEVPNYGGMDLPPTPEGKLPQDDLQPDLPPLQKMPDEQPKTETQAPNNMDAPNMDTPNMNAPDMDTPSMDAPMQVQQPIMPDMPATQSGMDMPLLRPPTETTPEDMPSQNFPKSDYKLDLETPLQMPDEENSETDLPGIGDEQESPKDLFAQQEKSQPPMEPIQPADMGEQRIPLKDQTEEEPSMPEPMPEMSEQPSEQQPEQMPDQPLEQQSEQIPDQPLEQMPDQMPGQYPPSDMPDDLSGQLDMRLPEEPPQQNIPDIEDSQPAFNLKEEPRMPKESEVFQPHREEIPQRRIINESLFVNVDVFRKTVELINSLSDESKMAEESLFRIKDITLGKEKIYDKWQTDLEQVERELIQLDKLLFNV